jgi:hypothetical protein
MTRRRRRPVRTRRDRLRGVLEPPASPRRSGERRVSRRSVLVRGGSHGRSGARLASTRKWRARSHAKRRAPTSSRRGCPASGRSWPTTSLATPAGPAPVPWHESQRPASALEFALATDDRQGSRVGARRGRKLHRGQAALPADARLKLTPRALAMLGGRPDTLARGVQECAGSFSRRRRRCRPVGLARHDYHVGDVDHEAVGSEAC